MRPSGKSILRASVVAGLLCVFILTGVKTSPAAGLQVEVLRKQLSTLDLKHPGREAQTHFKNGDKRFVAVQGYTYECPGVKDPAFVQAYGFRILRGTSDISEGKEYKHLNAVARAYAKAYNKELLKLIRKSRKFKGHLPN